MECCAGRPPHALEAGCPRLRRIQHPLWLLVLCWQLSRLPVHRIGTRPSARARPYPNKSSRQVQGPQRRKHRTAQFFGKQHHAFLLSFPLHPALRQLLRFSAPGATLNKVSLLPLAATRPSAHLPLSSCACLPAPAAPLLAIFFCHIALSPRCQPLAPRPPPTIAINCTRTDPSVASRLLPYPD